MWREWAETQGLDADAVAHASHGVPTREVIASVAPHLPAAEEAERLEKVHAATGGVALPGAAELLKRRAGGRARGRDLLRLIAGRRPAARRGAAASRPSS